MGVNKCWAAFVLIAFSLPAYASENTSFTYDAMGRVSSVCFSKTSKKISYNYDAAGNRSSVVTTNVSCPSGINNPPVANDDSFNGYYDDSNFINVLANDTDPDGDSLQVISATTSSSGCFVDYFSNGIDVYRGYKGSCTITYTVSDGRGGTDTATLVANLFLSPF